MTKTIKTTSNAKKINAQSCEEPCLIERGMRVLGGKWKASILWHLKDGPVRFNELSRMLGGASKKMVDQRLKELEVQGLVTREVISDRPIAVAYEITDFGRTALDILEKLKDWTQANNI
ncbi:winged helix-turn-helix transcriptional regulator [Colwellia sp. PAMC 20917]|uniref:winged helix-turn-helix transcriptional regulator n=1 Tax=Colwellia sp. PAMC 20917 TaxID=1816218 RepID=UPI003FA4A4DE